MFRLLSLSAKIKAVSLVFLLAGLASVSITLWVTWQLEGGAAAVNEAGRLRMQVFRMQLSFQNHEQHLLDQGNARFSASLQLLREGDPSRPLQILWTPSLRAQFARIEEGWQHLSRMQTAATLPEFRAQGDALVQVIDDLVTLLEREMVRWTAGLHLFLLMMVALVIGATIVFWMMSYWEVLYPLERLEGGMAHIRQGQLQTRLQLESSGEFGRVASGFNLMAASLQSARENLEFKVREKTASLQAQHAQLQALYTVSAQMAEADNLQTLAQGFVHQVRASVQAEIREMKLALAQREQAAAALWQQWQAWQDAAIAAESRATRLSTGWALGEVSFDVLVQARRSAAEARTREIEARASVHAANAGLFLDAHGFWLDRPSHASHETVDEAAVQMDVDEPLTARLTD